MWGRLLVVACTALTACMPDIAHAPIFLTAPYDALPPAPAGSTIEPGRPVGLNGRQQEFVVLGVLKWMKDPISVQFSGLAGVRNSRSLITVCGQVNGRNTAGRSCRHVAVRGRPDGTGRRCRFRPGRHRLDRA